MPSEKSVAEMLARVLTETVDNNAFLLTILDLQARILSRLEDRPLDDVVDEVNTLLKERRRSALRELDAWAEGNTNRPLA